jgi:hypothetical protein
MQTLRTPQDTSVRHRDSYNPGIRANYDEVARSNSLFLTRPQWSVPGSTFQDIAQGKDLATTTIQTPVSFGYETKKAQYLTKTDSRGVQQAAHIPRFDAPINNVVQTRMQLPKHSSLPTGDSTDPLRADGPQPLSYNIVVGSSLPPLAHKATYHRNKLPDRATITHNSFLKEQMFDNVGKVFVPPRSKYSSGVNFPESMDSVTRSVVESAVQLPITEAMQRLPGPHAPPIQLSLAHTLRESKADLQEAAAQL